MIQDPRILYARDVALARPLRTKDPSCALTVPADRQDTAAKRVLQVGSAVVKMILQSASVVKLDFIRTRQRARPVWNAPREHMLATTLQRSVTFASKDKHGSTTKIRSNVMTAKREGIRQG